MEFDSEKIIGYALLAVGVGMIFVSVFLMFNVFTGARSPPVIIQLSDLTIPVPIPGQSESISIFTGEELSILVSMSFWYILMFFVMVAGGKIASIGVNLIKEVKMELKE